MLMPALFTSTSARPQRSRTAAANLDTIASSAMSPRNSIASDAVARHRAQRIYRVRAQIAERQIVSALGQQLRGALPDALGRPGYDRDTIQVRHGFVIPSMSVVRAVQSGGFPRHLCSPMQSSGNSNPWCYTPAKSSDYPLFAGSALMANTAVRIQREVAMESTRRLRGPSSI